MDKHNDFGDWGLGIGDCPIPNPQSPIPKHLLKLIIIHNLH